jgi:hypothetical protein
MDRKIDVVEAALLVVSSPWMGKILRKLFTPVIQTLKREKNKFNILMLEFRRLPSGVIRTY